MTTLRSLAAILIRTPLHPQWLLGRRRAPGGLRQFSGTLLDIGAADRWIAAHVSLQAHYLALDHPSTGRVLYGSRPDVFADGARLPFVDGAIDGVVCLEVLEHVPDPANVVAEIERVLRPGGCAWISMPFLYPLHDAPFDFQRYTEFGLRRDLARAGLEVKVLTPTSNAVRAAGLLACLAIAGGVHGKRGAYLLLLPIAAVLVLLINCIAWAFSYVWPHWNAMTLGHAVQVFKP